MDIHNEGMCHTYFQLDHLFTEAWASGNHSKVMEIQRQIENHKLRCPICRDPAGLAAGLWPNNDVRVSSEDEPGPNVNVSKPRITKTG